MDQSIDGLEPYTRCPLDLKKLEASGTPSDRASAIEGWLALQQITLLTGRRGIGSSLLAQQIGTAISLGEDFIATVPKPRTVLLWDCEQDHNELWRRHVTLSKHYNSSLSAAGGRLFLEPLAGEECAIVEVVITRLMRTAMAKELYEQVGDYGAELVILNNIDRLFGGNHYDPHHRAEFISALRWALSPTGAAGLLVGEVAKQPRSKSGANKYTSTAWEDLCPAHLYLTAKIPTPGGLEDGEPDDDTRDVRYLRKRKVNYTNHEICKMVWDQGSYTIMPGTIGFDGSAQFELIEHVLIEGFERFKRKNIDLTPHPNSDNYLPRLLVNESRNEGFSERDLAQVMKRSDRFRIEAVGKYHSSRSRRKILVLVEDSP